MDYIYSREIVDGAYNIDNPLRLDGSSNLISLSKEIEVAIPAKHFKVICNAGECKVAFDDAISVEEKTTLDTVVSNHKNNI